MIRFSAAVRPRPRTPALLSAAVLAAVVALMSCGSDDGEGDGDDGAAPGRKAGASASDGPAASPESAESTSPASQSPSASPSPALPEPADGTDRAACADGTCEIRVTGPGAVPLPARYGLGPVEVGAVGAKTVELTAELSGPDFSSDGGCSAMITGPAGNVPGFVSMSCHAEETAVVNGLSLEVAGIADEGAVIRFGPAK